KRTCSEAQLFRPYINRRAKKSTGYKEIRIFIDSYRVTTFHTGITKTLRCRYIAIAVVRNVEHIHLSFVLEHMSSEGRWLIHHSKSAQRMYYTIFVNGHTTRKISTFTAAAFAPYGVATTVKFGQ